MTTTRPGAAARPLTLDDLLTVRTPAHQHRVALSPDGRYLAAATRLESRTLGGPAADPGTGAPSTAARAELWVTDLERGESWPLLGPEGRSWRPNWSPDGTTLAFYADHGGVVQLWCWQPASGAARAVSATPIYAHAFSADAPRWAADGTRVYVPLRPLGWQPRGVDAAKEAPAPPAGAPTVEVLVSRPAPEGGSPAAVRPAPDRAQRFRDVGAVDVRTGHTERLLTGFPALGVYPSPDGRWLAITTLGSQPDVARYRFVTEVYLLPAAGGAPRLVAEGLDHTGSGRHPPAWAPDAARLAFVRDGHLWLAGIDGAVPRPVALDVELDERLLLWHPAGGALLARGRDGHLWLVPVREPTPPAVPVPPVQVAAQRLALPARAGLAPVLHRNETDCFWSPDRQAGPVGPAGGSCVVGTQDPATMRGEFWRLPLDGAAPERLLAEDRAFTATAVNPIGSAGTDVSGDGRTVVYAAEDEAHPPDWWVADAAFRRRRRVTRLNPHLDGVAVGRSRLVSWLTTDGQEVHGALLLPPGYREGERVPLVASLYPGLALSRWLRRWNADVGAGVVHPQLLAARGYAVLLPDVPTTAALPRHGEPWPLARAGLAGTVLPGLNEAIRLGVADPERLGVVGQSAGGAAVVRLLTETTRFKAAVCSAGTADWTSYFGQLRVHPDGAVDTYGVPIAEAHGGGPPWAAPLRYVTESPVFFLDRIETPLLLVHGTADDAVGVEQAGELFVGLRRLGKAVTFLRYHGEGHVPASYTEANRRDVVARTLA